MRISLLVQQGREGLVEDVYKRQVPGFRPGKAPRKMIERMYGAEVFFEEAINIAFPEAYEAAAEQEKLQIVGYPTVEMAVSYTHLDVPVRFDVAEVYDEGGSLRISYIENAFM